MITKFFALVNFFAASHASGILCLYCVYTVVILRLYCMCADCYNMLFQHCGFQHSSLKSLKNMVFFNIRVSNHQHASLKSLKNIMFFNIWPWNHWKALCFFIKIVWDHSKTMCFFIKIVFNSIPKSWFWHALVNLFVQIR